MKIIVCTEARAGRLEPHSLELVELARGLLQPGDELVGFFAGESADCALAALGAVERLYVATAPQADVMPAVVYERVLAKVVEAEGPALVLTSYSVVGLDVAAALAARVGWPMVSYVSQVKREGEALAVTAQMYGGKILCSCAVPPPAILMINPGSSHEVVPSPLDPAKCRVVDAPADLAAGGVKVKKIEVSDSVEVNLGEAERIVCVGRGIGDSASIELVRPLALRLGAEIAGSRPVVDNGWLPKYRQVGKSGQKVKPKLYLALGVSGAPEHLEGMSKADLIIAVNTDPNAPIFNLAHYGATCDLFDLIESLKERLQTAAGG